ncbi:hypothetical protein BJ912DRAFT_925035 [Pholiota molesta]|nr:hypothetical protein BJ912DRAFT_925035 [Pholiota molesta]
MWIPEPPTTLAHRAQMIQPTALPDEHRRPLVRPILGHNALASPHEDLEGHADLQDPFTQQFAPSPGGWPDASLQRVADSINPRRCHHRQNVSARILLPELLMSACASLWWLSLSPLSRAFSVLPTVYSSSAESPVACGARVRVQVYLRLRNKRLSSSPLEEDPPMILSNSRGARHGIARPFITKEGVCIGDWPYIVRFQPNEMVTSSSGSHGGGTWPAITAVTPIRRVVYRRIVDGRRGLKCTGKKLSHKYVGGIELWLQHLRRQRSLMSIG